MKKKLIILMLVLFMPILMLLGGCGENEYTVYINQPSNVFVEASAGGAKEGDVITLNYSNLADGYELVNYTLNNNVLYTNSFIMPASNVTVSAIVEPINYEVNYNIETGVVNNNPNSYTINSETINLQNPTRKGYNFLGWYSESNFLNKVTQIIKGSTENIVLYPKWELINYPIKYNLFGGTNNLENIEFFTVESSEFKLKNPTKPNADFIGWYENSNFSGNPITTISFEGKTEVELYAKFVSTEIDVDGYRLINSEVDLVEILVKNHNINSKYRLTKDLDLNNIETRIIIGNYSNGKPFTGEFDGCGYSINNLKISNGNTGRAGLFGYIKNATIKNLKISYNYDFDISSYTFINIGGLVGESNETNLIENCHVINSNININNLSERVYAGGIIGRASENTTINKCSVTNCNIYVCSRLYSYVGGISGYDGKISECTVDQGYFNNNAVNIIGETFSENAYAYVGGLVGYLGNAQLTNSCFVSLGNLSAVNKDNNSYSFSGGLVGNGKNITITNCYSDITKIQSNGSYCAFAGGLVAKLSDDSKINMSFIDSNIVEEGYNISCISKDKYSCYAGYFVGEFTTEKVLGSLISGYANELTTFGINNEIVNSDSITDANSLDLADKIGVISFGKTAFDDSVWTIPSILKKPYINYAI